jgi:7-carboxy-7-deazaguanine synthase
MSYAVKEIFYTLQGEGARTGRAAVFLRFAGCNLWNGVEADRADAVCRFCDTDFVGTDGDGGGKFADAEALAAAVAALWPKGNFAQPYVVCTGGEPLLQLDEALIAAITLPLREGRNFRERQRTGISGRGLSWQTSRHTPPRKISAFASIFRPSLKGRVKGMWSDWLTGCAFWRNMRSVLFRSCTTGGR